MRLAGGQVDIGLEARVRQGLEVLPMLVHIDDPVGAGAELTGQPDVHRWRALKPLLKGCGVIGPYLPATSLSIAQMLQLDVGAHVPIPDRIVTDQLKPGHKLGEPKLLFSTIKPEKEKEWREQFGGEEAREPSAAEDSAQEAAQAIHALRRFNEERSPCERVRGRVG